MAAFSYIARKLFAAVAVLALGPLGLVFALFALGWTLTILSALLTGEFVRDDFREATGEVRILLSADPDWFWSNIYFWSGVAVICALMGSIFVPLSWVALKSLLGRSKARKPDQLEN